MAVTSQWEWASINRAKDFTIVNSQNVFRENWSIERFRISDDTYSSQLGESATSITAYNGGVTETVNCPTYPAYSFDTSQNWVNAGVLWIPTGFTRSGVAAYKYVESAKYNSTKNLVLFLGTISGTARYLVAEVTSSELSSGTWLNEYSDYSALGLGTSHKSSSYTTLTGTYTGVAPYSGNSTLSSTATSATFYCTSDTQIYNTSGVSWYTQRQVWQSKTPWGY